MHLAEAQLRDFEDNGYLVLTDLFTPDEVDLIKSEVVRLADEDHPGTVREEGSGLVRAIHGSHLVSALLDRVTRLPRLVDPALDLLGDDLYVYQFKVNFKRAFGGEVWPWHQDYVYWHQEDGMREPHAMNVAIYLDEVSEFNGPLMFVPGTHSRGLVDAPDGEPDEEDWRSHVSASLKYTLERATLERAVAERGIVAPKGPAGTVLVFHPNIYHASVPNLSPIDRTMLIVTYNRVDNAPDPHSKRPEFLVSRDPTPLQAVAEGVLTAETAPAKG